MPPLFTIKDVNLLRRATLDRLLPPFAWTVLAFMVLVILEGAVVRATGSGAGCGNHWPLCNGQILPHHPRLATVIEFTHRSMTGVLSALAAALVCLIFWLRPAGHPARRMALWVVFFLITEALLGAVLVKGGYVESNASNMRVFVQGVHFTNTMLLVAALTLAAWRTRDRFVAAKAADKRWALVALAATLIAGATGSIAALADTLYPAPSLGAGLMQDFAANAPLLVRMRWLHPAASLLVLVALGGLAMRHRSRAVRVAMGLVAFQFLLGVADIVLLAPTWLQVLHLLGADLFWVALVVVFAESEPRRAAAPEAAYAG